MKRAQLKSFTKKVRQKIRSQTAQRTKLTKGWKVKHKRRKVREEQVIRQKQPKCKSKCDNLTTARANFPLWLLRG